MIRSALRTLCASTFALMLAAPHAGAQPNTSWYFDRGAGAMKVSDFRAAAEAYEKVLESDPFNKRALLLSAQAYQGQGLADKAIHQYERYLEKYPADGETAFKEAELMRQSPSLYEPSRVAHYYRVSVEADGSHIDRRLRFADYVAGRQSGIAEAIAQYQAVLKKDRANSRARAGLVRMHLWNAGLLSASKTTLTQAIHEYETVQHLDPSNKEARENLLKLRQWYASTLSQQPDDFPKAIEEAEKLSRAQPDDPKLHARWVDLRIQYADRLAGDSQTLPEAVIDCQRLAQDEPQDTRVHDHCLSIRLRQADALGDNAATMSDAIAQYQDILNAESNDLRLRRRYVQMRLRYAATLASSEDSLEEAIAEYEKLEQEEPDAPEVKAALVRTRLWYAGVLSRDAETLVEAIAQYEEVIKEDPQNAKAAAELATLQPWYASRLSRTQTSSATEQRLDHAGQLASNRLTLAQAMQEYQAILQEEPGNGRAHLGLARGYAWMGNGDRAWDEARLAQGWPGLTSDDKLALQNLEDQLATWRRPAVSAQGQYFEQRGTTFALRGNGESLAAKFDPSSWMTLTARGEAEHYWTDGESADDHGGALGVQMRFHTVNRLEAEGDYHDMTQQKDRDVLFHALYGYGWDGGPFWLKLGVKRELKYDSFLSLVGQTIDGQSLGHAFSNSAFMQVGAQWGRVSFRAAPYAGWVKSRGLEENPEQGGDGEISVALAKTSSTTVALGYQAQLLHDKYDQSAFTPSDTGPAAGGYFSPQHFVSHSPRLIWKHAGKRWDFSFEGGPSYQYVRTDNAPGVYQWAGDANLSLTYHMTSHWNLNVSPGYSRVATVYNRAYINGALTYTFGRAAE